MQIKFWTLAFALAFLHGCVSSENSLEASVDPSLLWGPYRSNVFFGIRPRIPESLLIGLMWVHTENGIFAEDNLRHACNDEGMAGYGWDTYDPRTGGTQSFHDVGNFIDITTELFKPSDADACCQWGVRITGNLRLDAPKDIESLVVFYVGTEERMPTEESFLHCTKLDEGNEVHCYGNQLNLQNFTLQIRDRAYIGEGKQAKLGTSIRSDAVPADGMWQAKGKSLFAGPYTSSCAILKSTIHVETLTTGLPKISTWLTSTQMRSSPRKELSISSKTIIKELSRCVTSVPELIDAD